MLVIVVIFFKIKFVNEIVFMRMYGYKELYMIYIVYNFSYFLKIWNVLLISRYFCDINC